MNTKKLRKARDRFENQIDAVLTKRKNLYDLRDSFCAYYTLQRIESMPLKYYAIGRTSEESHDNVPNFCYTLEIALGDLGEIRGSRAIKFGIYYRKDEGKYRYAKKFGSSQEEAYSKIKRSIIGLIKAGEAEEIDKIADNKIAPMFKGKILSTFFPDRYLNIFSGKHLDYFLEQLNLEKSIKSNAVRKRERLLAFKNQDSAMRDWSVDIFAYFLYEYLSESLPQK